MPTVALSIGLTEPIGEYSTLVNTVRAWTNRSDFTDVQITEFIAIAEARFNRIIRHPEMEEIASTTLTTGNNNLPDGFISMRSITTAKRELEAMSPTGLTGRYRDLTGEPVAYTLIGSNPRKIRLGPQPTAPTAVTMVYYKKITGVDENNADNWLLNEHPDIYLYGTLLAAEAYLANDDRLPIWKAAFDEALAEIDQAANRDRYGSAPLTMKGVPQVRGVRA